jgi:flagellar biosynthesis protein FliR
VTLVETLLLSEVRGFMLTVARIAGLIVIAPLPWSVAPVRVRAAFVVVLAFVAHSLGSPIQSGGILDTALGGTLEFGVGALMGLVVRLSVAAAEVAGGVLSPMIGLGAAHIFDPHSKAQESVLEAALKYFTLLLATVAGVHRIVLGSLLESFKVIPVGFSFHVEAAMPVVIKLSSECIASGVRIAMPLIAILFVTQIALAYVSRAAPALQIFSIGFAVTLAVGFGCLTLILPDMAQRLLAELSRIPAQMELILAPVVTQ